MSSLRKVFLGRPSNNLTSGIVGLANVGKSTFFQAITKSQLGNPANYPFATIEPEEAKVQIPSPRLDHLQKLYQSEKKVPATLTVYDIAGLVRGASQGQGMGSAFLNDIKHVDGIFHVVRGFQNTDITHIEGSVDPLRDLSVVQDELVLKDLEFLENIKEKLSKKMGRTAKNSHEFVELEQELNFLSELEEHLYEGRKIIHFKKDWTPFEVSTLNKHNFLTAKPTLLLLNVTPEDYILQKNEFVADVKRWIKEFAPGDELMLFSAEFETLCAKHSSDSDPFKKYLHEQLGLDPSTTWAAAESALPQAIVKMRELLGLISFFTCGPSEVRQWTVRQGSTAPEAASVIHTDLQDTFINANVIKYDDLAQLEPPFQESALKSQGKIKRVGKQHIMEDNSIVVFQAAGAKAR
ncbi:hypothetical protein HG536_0G01370 [Torulaspora globosa]|uniref:Obg-like ATPase homolog n=1 Tax=Torulaspora globosa TaxID=48254 RepID=A0A7G3ZL92_9SACH|nr:uncharacterized protein HG536_0G01370 [Torulaspora globosa]QLL34278.1 hypothetical protein HG536_0G01370 [Torulaspora globosa]